MSGDERFWAKVNMTGDCWLWTGYSDSRGYGHLRRGGRKVYAHRYSLTLNGINVDGMTVDHTCHRPSCVRPTHLRLTTHKQNIENRRGANRNSQTGIRGVSWDKANGRWRGSVKHNYKLYSKSFHTKADATAWVVAKRLELFSHNDLDRVA